MKTTITGYFDDAQLQAGGGAKLITRVRFTIETGDRTLGPLEVILPRDADSAAVSAAIQQRAAALVGNV